ncbi:ribonuclease H-like domain-containing protein [Mycena latifolia]|nr:ribonuclease H-like domain-containing protein [Mycena latifolia]
MNDKKTSSGVSSESSKDTEARTDTDITIIDVDAEPSEATTSRKKRKAITGPLASFVDQAMSQTQQNSADRKLLRILDAEAADTFLRETERLQRSKLLTLLEDGWEDRLKRSIYGVVAAGIDTFPVVMSLDDLTGERGNAAKCLDIAVNSLQLMGVPDARNFIGLTTDNPTTMQPFRRLFQHKFFWVLTFACFLHSLNTLVGEICSYPLIKKIISKANRAVTFFNGSHYWGGQLKTGAKRLDVSRGQKKFVPSHRQPMSIICLRPDAQKKTNGFSAVGSDVIAIVLNTPEFWPLLNQVTRITKPIVDAIGNCESCQTTLADCMLELIHCARTMGKMTLEEDHTTFFSKFTRVFVSSSALSEKKELLSKIYKIHGHSLDLMIETALKIAHQWKWSAQKAIQLREDLKKYYQCKAPFAGGNKDTREWWEGIPKDKHEGLRSMAIVLASIVPHSAEVERLFSDLGGIQTPRRSLMAVDTMEMEKSGKIRSRVGYELYERARADEKVKRRKHNHMHTSGKTGIDADLAKDLENPITWIPPLDGNDDDTGEDIVEQASKDLQKLLDDEAPVAIPHGSVIAGEVVDFEELERLDRGETSATDEDNIDIVGNAAEAGWGIQDLMTR